MTDAERRAAAISRLRERLEKMEGTPTGKPRVAERPAFVPPRPASSPSEAKPQPAAEQPRDIPRPTPTPAEPYKRVASAFTPSVPANPVGSSPRADTFKRIANAVAERPTIAASASSSVYSRMASGSVARTQASMPQAAGASSIGRSTLAAPAVTNDANAKIVTLLEKLIVLATAIKENGEGTEETAKNLPDAKPVEKPASFMRQGGPSNAIRFRGSSGISRPQPPIIG